jgi:hypothetical protein
MKKITILIVTIFSLQIVNAQVKITLSMNPRPVANISDWANRRDVLTLIVMPGGPVGLPNNVKINTIIKTTDGTTVAVTDMLKAPVKNLVQGSTNIFYAADVVNLQAMVFVSSFQNKLNKTGQLPAGSYQIIVELDSTSLPITLSNTQTKIFFLAATQLPVLTAPANEAILNPVVAQTAITFRWTPIAPLPADAVHYHVQVFEVLADQTPMQALRSNQPLLDKEVIGTTQFIWRPQLSFGDGTDKKFVWTIQSFDFQGQVITGEVANGEGRSEAKVFVIANGGKH